MIKLKQLIKESLNDMVFTKTINPKHKKRMNLETKMFPSNLKLTMTPPPTNDSNETRTEIFKLLAYNNTTGLTEPVIGIGVTYNLLKIWDWR